MRHEAIAHEYDATECEGHSGVVFAPAKSDAAGFALTLPEVSEELRGNVSNILGFAELLEQGRAGPLSERQSEFVGYILDGGKRLRTLVERTGARVDLVEPPTGPRQWALLSGVLEDTAHTLKATAREKGVSIRLNVPELEPMFFEPSAVLQVLHNMIFNTMDVAPVLTSITLRVTEEPRAIIIHLDLDSELKKESLGRVLSGPLPVLSLRRIIEFHGIRLVRPKDASESWALRIPHTPGLGAAVEEEP